MRNPLFVGLGLGLVAAVVFASATTGPLLVRFLLFFITPLPIALAGLGWGSRTAAIAGASGTALVAVGASPLLALVFAISQVIPVAALSHLTLLSRAGPAGSDGKPTIEWYPAGRLIIWAGLIAGLLSVTSLVLMGADLDELRSSLGEFIDRTLKSGLPQMPGAPPLSDTEIKALSEVALGLLPAASAMSWMASLLFNLWLGGRITLASGQLARPWPDLAAIQYPRGTALVFAGILLATMLGGYAGLTASAFAGAFFVAYVLLGLAIIHYTTRGKSWRPFALWALYAALLLVNVWIAVVVALLGVAEAILALRQRYPPAGGP